MNSFDIVVLLALAVAVVTGFNTGLLRSAVTILAYLVAMPIAVSAVSVIAPLLGGKIDQPFAQNWGFFLGLFLAAGMGLGKLARMALDMRIARKALRRGRRLLGAGLGFPYFGELALDVA